MRRLARLIVVILLGALVFFNYRLHYRPCLAPTTGGVVNRDVYRQLNFLQERMHHGAPAEMQALFPEGFVYMHALYGLAWLDLTKPLPINNQLKQRALAEAAWSISAIDSDSARLKFDADLPLPYGAFYQGWLAYLEGRYLAAYPPPLRPAAAVTRYQHRCELLAQALRQSTTPYLESYRGAAWPADGLLGVAALANHDRLFLARYHAERRTWLAAANERLDSLGLIPHEVDATTGQVRQAARGSSQSQLLNFLVEVDSSYAQVHFERYRRHFLTSRLGLPGIREASNEDPTVADIDAGPVIWGVGGAASIVGRRTLQRFGDTATATGLRNSIEACGLPWQYHEQKRYLLGQLPMADAFIAWTNALENQRTLLPARGWNFEFRLVSAILAVGLVWIWRGLRNRTST